jgi:predicted DNA-binding ribbon-helix-helix protein
MRDGRGRPRSTSTIVKRSLVIAGHATSVSLEGAFWDGLKAVAAARSISVAALVAEIDGTRDAANLSSAIRVHVLEHFRSGAWARRDVDPRAAVADA